MVDFRSFEETLKDITGLHWALDLTPPTTSSYLYLEDHKIRWGSIEPRVWGFQHISEGGLVMDRPAPAVRAEEFESMLGQEWLALYRDLFAMVE